MRISITGKICFILLIVFSLVIISTTLYQAVRERELVMSLSSEHVKNQMDNFRFGVDLIVKNQHPEELASFKNEFANQPHIVHVKWIQSDTNALLGNASEQTKPATKEESEGLDGQTFQHLFRNKGQNRLVLIAPYFIAGQTKPAAAIRIEYTLDDQLEMVEKHIFYSAIMLAFIFSGVLLMTLIITRKHIVEPLHRLRQAMDDITDFDDVEQRLPVRYNDEIDQLNASFNDLAEYIANKNKEQH